MLRRRMRDPHGERTTGMRHLVDCLGKEVARAEMAAWSMRHLAAGSDAGKLATVIYSHFSTFSESAR